MCNPLLCRVALGGSTLLLLALSYRITASDRLEAQILDNKTGQPVAATVVITDGNGKVVEVDGKHPHVTYLGKRRCYVDGAFSLASRSGRMTVQLRRGLETLPLQAEIDLSRQRSEPLTFRLRRWIDMREQGYLSGDSHVHMLTQAESHFQMRAEDLNVLNLLVTDISHDIEKFTGKLDPVSTPGHSVYVGQEFRDWQQGHLVLMRIKQIIQPFEPFGGTFQGRSNPHHVLAKALRETRQQGGVTTWAHFCNLPGTESAIDIALGLVDALELITYDDPTQLPSHWGPWKTSGMSQGEFTVMRSMDLYYQYLNAGIRLPIGAGTDKMSEGIPVGSNRLYARYTDAPPSYDAWLAGLKAGNGFVTNGPMLTFEVDGHTAGDVVKFDGSKRVKARATAQSILPFASLEIVVNGETAPIQENDKQVGGVYQMEVETTLDLQRSSWVAARVAEEPGMHQRILPRGLTVFAHTNPLYYLRGGAKVREAGSIAYLQKYVKAATHWLNTGARFATPAEKEEALRLADQARRIYAGL
jgi:hypothetical protein